MDSRLVNLHQFAFTMGCWIASWIRLGQVTQAATESTLKLIHALNEVNNQVDFTELED
jgi:hypothetical protein